MRLGMRVAIVAVLGLLPWARAAGPESRPLVGTEGLPPGDDGADDLLGDDSYTVRDGDTLWDLSQRFLNNPWYWPKIWADNPVIENPHWIQPGATIRIRSGAGGDPSSGGPASVERPPPASDPGFVTEPLAEPAPYFERSTRNDVDEDFSVAALDGSNALGQGTDLVSVSGRGALGRGIAKPVRLRLESILTGAAFQEAGRIESSFEQKELLATFDRVHVRLADPAGARIGQEYSIFRQADRDGDGEPDEILHPVTHRSYGYQTLLAGSLRIVALEGPLAIGEVTATFVPVERGDRLGPALALDRTVRAAPNARSLEGVILATQTARQSSIAENAVVFVDQGSNQGVASGNTFTVVQYGDGLESLEARAEPALAQAASRGPGHPVASLVVFDVQPESSAAIVVKSLREVVVGDRVVMRPQGGSGGDLRR